MYFGCDGPTLKPSYKPVNVTSGCLNVTCTFVVEAKIMRAADHVSNLLSRSITTLRLTIERLRK